MTRIKGGIRIIFMVLFSCLFVGCATPDQQSGEQTLPPPAHPNPKAGRALLEGNKLYSEHQWTAAIRKFEEAIETDPSLAEAHYNLTLTLDQQGRFSESPPHYKRAAKLAPGNPVIRNAPPFRNYGIVEKPTQEQDFDRHGGHHH